jgi:hypothetical protein
VTLFTAIYVAGVLWVVAASAAPPVPRIGLALLWTIGPLAFVVTVVFLVVIAPVALIGRR